MYEKKCLQKLIVRFSERKHGRKNKVIPTWHAYISSTVTINNAVEVVESILIFLK